MCCELTVTCKDSDSSYKQKFLVYEDFKMNLDDPVIKAYVQAAKENFNSESDDIDIKVRCLMVVQ